ncbi:MAG: SufD family Fe-S cluster assembly protein [Bacilli bacterium]|nr:SufD family Fe-S cluster assembly protein [Bacilli bacterium]
MNKLIIDNVDELSDLIITEDTNLLINLNNSNGFIHIDVMDNMCLYVLEFGNNTKNKVEYNLKANSKVIINKVSVNTSDKVYINLNGENSSIVYNTSIINIENNIYYQMINHNCSNTISNINNHAINVGDKSMVLDIDAKVFNGSSNCETNQDNKIINNSCGKNEIKPNLLVDNNLIEATHSAYIGSFSPDIIFYLKTRGINEEQIQELLTTGFLIEKMDLLDEEKDTITTFIKNYI